jgi:hypothetical protein
MQSNQNIQKYVVIVRIFKLIRQDPQSTFCSQPSSPWLNSIISILISFSWHQIRSSFWVGRVAILLSCSDPIGIKSRVARWQSFKPKIPIWVNFGVSYKGWSWMLVTFICVHSLSQPGKGMPSCIIKKISLPSLKDTKSQPLIWEPRRTLLTPIPWWSTPKILVVLGKPTRET